MDVPKHVEIVVHHLVDLVVVEDVLLIVLNHAEVAVLRLVDLDALVHV